MAPVGLNLIAMEMEAEVKPKPSKPLLQATRSALGCRTSHGSAFGDKNTQSRCWKLSSLIVAVPIWNKEIHLNYWNH